MGDKNRCAKNRKGGFGPASHRVGAFTKNSISENFQDKAPHGKLLGAGPEKVNDALQLALAAPNHAGAEQETTARDLLRPPHTSLCLAT